MALRNTSTFKPPILVSNRPDNALVAPPPQSLDQPELERVVDFPDCGVRILGTYQSGKTQALQALQERLRSKGRRVEAYNAASLLQ
jgi:hypothetical protein